MRSDETVARVDLAAATPFRIGALEIRPATREVMLGPRRDVLEPRVMQVLVALARRTGEVVSRDELTAACWGGRVVGEDSLSRCISALRRVATKYGGFSIHTVARVGYRLVSADLESVSSTPQARRVPLVLGAAVAAVAVAAAVSLAFMFGQANGPTYGPAGQRVAVVRFAALPEDRAMDAFATELAGQITDSLSANQIETVARPEADSLSLADPRGAAAKLGVRLIVSGSVQSRGPLLHVAVELNELRDAVNVWSHEYDGPADDASLLQARVAAHVSGVLACARRALRPHGGLAAPEQLRRYLRACDLSVDLDAGTGHDMVAAFEWLLQERELTRAAPNFAPAHSDLAIGDATVARWMPALIAGQLRKEADAEATKALSIDPISPDAYSARYSLLPIASWAEREAMLRKAVATDPRWPNTEARLGLMLAETGRLSEAMAYTQQAAAAEVNVSWAPANAFVNCGAGQTDRGIEDIRAFLRLFPESQYAVTLAETCLMDAGRWADADKAIDAAPLTWDIHRDEAHAFYRAAQSHAPGDIAEARRLALAVAEGDPNVASNSMEVLSSLGLVDDAFTVARKFDPQTSYEPSSFLFFPITARLRQDPRFIALAARIGLVKYWQDSGHWPDFCSDPTLPYDCKIEAARLTATHP